jgi:hypothetical protein
MTQLPIVLFERGIKVFATARLPIPLKELPSGARSGLKNELSDTQRTNEAKRMSDNRL